ncbi:conserved hypothetical protein [Neospora caninum Liverpool]|nr:conserved hypothetical protein [Neospora caninum Liverpool]CBZ54184.1 conserved hypothetical protein [Neospora caninum Liverpool]|eukprot:XP_003884215.1 conserved hypothetical protein [Neospora caninum Liverpool]
MQRNLQWLWRLGADYRGFCPLREISRPSSSRLTSVDPSGDGRFSSAAYLRPIRRVSLVGDCCARSREAAPSEGRENWDGEAEAALRCCGHKNLNGKQEEQAVQGPHPHEASRGEPFCSRCFYETFVMTRTPALIVSWASEDKLRPPLRSKAITGQATKTRKRERTSSPSSLSSAASPSSLASCLSGSVVDVALLQREWLHVAALKRRAGTLEVDVEERERRTSVSSRNGERGAAGAFGEANREANFGQGAFRRCRFAEFLDRLENGDETLYLTTQRVPHSRDGPRRLCGAPLMSPLAVDFPAVPSLFGNLQPYQYNLWCGHAESGSTTGLHHDFHDNLYVLLRGRKIFRLFSPRCAGLLPTKGQVTRVYPNGLICYSSYIREDGGHEHAVRRWKQEKAEERLSLLQERLEACTRRRSEAAKETGDRVEKAEGAKLAEDDRAESAADLELQIAEAERELDDLLDQALEDMVESEDESTASESEDVSEETTPNALRMGRLVGEGETPEHFCLENTRERTPSDRRREGYGDTAEPITPDNVLSKFWEVEILPGEMLYLPAGWFHEVHSFSSRTDQSSGVTQGQAPFHMALNFWFHPPVFGASYELPYGDTFWKDRTRPLLEAHSSLIAKFDGSASGPQTADAKGVTAPATVPRSLRSGQAEGGENAAQKSDGERQKEDADEESSGCFYSSGSGSCRKETPGSRKRLHGSRAAQTDSFQSTLRIGQKRLVDAWQAHCALKYAGRRCLMYRVRPEFCYFFDPA